MHTDTPLLNLRPETAQDVHFLAQLFRSTREDLLQLPLPEAMLSNLVEMQFNAQQSSYRQHFPDAEFSVIEKDGERIGRLITHDGDTAIRLVCIALLPQARNQGHGRYLLQTLQAAATFAGKPLALSVSTQNAAAERLYLSLGFQTSHDDGANLEMIWHAAANAQGVAPEFFK